MHRQPAAVAWLSDQPAAAASLQSAAVSRLQSAQPAASVQLRPPVPD